ncbi:MAG: EF-hand domain pair family protein [Verrucomicrobiaceae bacterium]|nr:EF-hand domain pair family protein [Verrucomicrobiaceae bacterium]
MNKFLNTLVAGVFITAGAAAFAGDGMEHGMEMHDMKAMDTNGDGMISKAEFMKYHEAKFDKMKNKDGMLDVKSMHDMGPGAADMKDTKGPGMTPPTAK